MVRKVEMIEDGSEKIAILASGCPYLRNCTDRGSECLKCSHGVARSYYMDRQSPLLPPYTTKHNLVTSPISYQEYVETGSATSSIK